MTELKGWSWENVKNPIWLEPCEESNFFAHKWMKNFKERNTNRERKPSIMDLECGLGRHPILFAKAGSFSSKEILDSINF